MISIVYVFNIKGKERERETSLTNPCQSKLFYFNFHSPEEVIIIKFGSIKTKLEVIYGNVQY